MLVAGVGFEPTTFRL